MTRQKILKILILPIVLAILVSCNQESKPDNGGEPISDSSTSKKEDKPAAVQLLIGTWSTEETEDVAVLGNGGSEMTFSNDGKLVYQIFEKGNMQQINLEYWIVGDTLFSDQPSNPQVEKALYRFEGDSKLILDYDGEKTVLYRVKEIEH